MEDGDKTEGRIDSCNKEDKKNAKRWSAELDKDKIKT